MQKKNTLGFFIGCVALLLTSSNCGNSPIHPANDMSKGDLGELTDLAQPDLTPNADLSSVCPGQFYLVDRYKGVVLCRKDYDGGQPDFVWVGNLAEGAKFLSHTNDVAPFPNNSDGPSPYPLVGANPNFVKLLLDTTLWNNLLIAHPRMVALINGSFHDAVRPYSPAPFTIKQNGVVVSAGHNMKSEFNFAGYIRLLRIDHMGHRADIVDFEPDNYEANLTEFDTVIGGLRHDAQKLNPTGYTGRTMVGTNGAMFYVFSSAASKCIRGNDTDDGGYEILIQFGARPDQIFNLDGGSSTGLIRLKPNTQQPEVLVSQSARPLPFYMYISSAP